MNLLSSTNKRKISIGIPVYNGEEFLRKRIDSVLEQTCKDIEIIISDNASTDLTESICKEYVKRDSRIQYFRQNKNLGMMSNFNFLVQKASAKYFVWAAVDDSWDPTFLEKNIAALDSDKNMVGSISKLSIFSSSIGIFSKEKSFLKKLGLVYRPHGTCSLRGTYEYKIRTFLKKFPWQQFYGVYRTDELRKSLIGDHFVSDTVAVVLNLLRYGDINEIDEILLQIYSGGASSKGMFYAVKLLNEGYIGKMFPHYPLTKWCIKNLGIKIFFRNFDCFIRLNLDAQFLLFINIIKIVKIRIKLKRKPKTN